VDLICLDLVVAAVKDRCLVQVLERFLLVQVLVDLFFLEVKELLLETFLQVLHLKLHWLLLDD
jgi:hypothetical protein